MATPLDLRNRRKEAQRVVRLATNATHAALDAWKRAVTEGKQHATQLSNAVLTQGHLPGLDLGPLPGAAAALEAAALRLAAQQAQHVEALARSLAALEAAAAELHLAAGSVAELAELEREAPLLGDRPVFASLSLTALCGMWGEVAAAHEAELAVKRAVVEGFREVVAEARPGDGAAGAERRGGPGEADGVRRRMTVYVSAWLLSPEVDDGRVEAHLAALAEEMRGM